MTSFAGKTIVVSGASSGIGRSIVEHLGHLGANLILIGRNRKRLEEAAARSEAKVCRILELDLGETTAIAPAIEDAARAIGRLYGLCHAAGTVETLQFGATTPEKFQSMLSVNYFGGMELARAVCRRDLLESDGGSILFISSIYGLIGKAGQVAYSGSKGALTAAARSMAIELARRNVRVNVLSPGMVWTEMTEKALARLTPQQVQALKDYHPLGIGTVEDIAKAAAFLLSPSSKWITGTDLVVDGGYSAQ